MARRKGAATVFPAYRTACSVKPKDEPMGSFEQYDDNELRSFTPEQRKTLQALHIRFDEKFDEIAALLAKQLGYRSESQEARYEAEEAIDQWAEDVEIADDPIEPKSDLQRLLHEHYLIAEEIMDVREGY
jgi:hypothetical protein